MPPHPNPQRRSDAQARLTHRNERIRRIRVRVVASAVALFLGVGGLISEQLATAQTSSTTPQTATAQTTTATSQPTTTTSQATTTSQSASPVTTRQS